MKRFRWACVAALAISGMAPVWAKAEDAKPAATQPARPPAADPTKPMPKGGNDKQKQDFLNRHEGFMKDKAALLAKGPIQFVAIGDSITDGWRGGNGKKTWETAFGAYNPYNIGIGGDQTQHVIWRIDQGELDGIDPNPKVAMIMIGTNNLGNKDDAAIAAGVTKVVKETHEKLPKTKILLLGIFPRGNKATDQARARIKSINEVIAKLDDGGKTVKYLDIGEKFLTADGELTKDIMPDFLHPNAKGYEIWAEAVKPAIDELMK